MNAFCFLFDRVYNAEGNIVRVVNVDHSSVKSVRSNLYPNNDVNKINVCRSACFKRYFV